MLYGKRKGKERVIKKVEKNLTLIRVGEAEPPG